MSEHPKTPLTPFLAGCLRVRAAMEHVEEAQRELGRAQADLCSVIGYTKEFDRLRKLYEAVKTEWYRLDGKLRSVPPKTNPRMGQLDREPNEKDAEPHRQGCGGR